jgi:hypothetical protein
MGRGIHISLLQLIKNRGDEPDDDGRDMKTLFDDVHIWQTQTRAWSISSLAGLGDLRDDVGVVEDADALRVKIRGHEGPNVRAASTTTCTSGRSARMLRFTSTAGWVCATPYQLTIELCLADLSLPCAQNRFL